ncbi:MAG: MurR/RpiR family transcriptional regulator [OCS116 cluster bacterium]|uniref:RpiR family transcriptional regulator n=1 Tax=OCS116 cluster bacterium TaxID=2030921 RepID=A0A2A4Z068_9PROT|nr:MurR/RpiR family transcriptional regulator [OCS116 cluster bacterium]
MSDETNHTIAERIRSQFEDLTKSERRLAEVMMENYPISSLGSITAIAKAAKVSTPSLVRMAKKLGFNGYPEMQEKLHQELKDTISNPIAKHDRWAEGTSNTHILNRFADAVMDNMRQSLGQLDVAEFDAVIKLLINKKSDIYVVGGRITRSLADYFYTQMQVMRDGLTLIAPNSNTWAHYIINMQEGDTLIAFDIRRYETDILHLAEMAKKKKLKLILFTDQWGSPVGKYADHAFHSRIEVPSAWDSNIVTMFILESLLAGVQSATWEDTKRRMKTLETLFDHTKLFDTQ